MPTFVPPHRQSVYCRLHIPVKLRPFFNGRREVWKSLTTTDRQLAEVKAAKWEAQGRALFLALGRRGKYMHKFDIERLVASWLESELEDAEDYRAVNGPFIPGGPSALLNDTREEYREDLAVCDYSRIKEEAVDILKAAGITLNHDGVDFGRLCRRLLRAKLEYLEIEAERWTGHYRQRSSQNPYGLGHASPSLRSTPLPQFPPETHQNNVLTPRHHHQGPRIAFLDVVARYMKESPKAPRSAKQFVVEFNRFLVAIGGDESTRIDSITKAHCVIYKDDLLQKRHVSLVTCAKHMAILAALFSWAEKQGYIPDRSNPARGLAPNRRLARKQAQERRPFTDTELVTVLGSHRFTSQRSDHPERYWSVLLCLFQVCRREEAVQLRINDIGEHEGIPYIIITDSKNDAVKRRVPLHPSLIELGFLGYVNQIKAQQRHTRLFPQFPEVAGRYSDALGKWFGKLMTAIGLTDPGLVLHSFRHNGVTRFHEVGIPEAHARFLTGHSGGGDVHASTYMHRELFSLTVLRASLERLRYDEVVKALA